jgi:hypothetical protein
MTVPRHGEKRLTHGVDDQNIRQLGEVVINFSQLTATMEMIVIPLLGAGDTKGSMVVADLNFRALYDLVNALYRHYEADEEWLEFFDTTMREIDNLAKERNKLNHTMIMPGEKAIELRSGSKRKFKNGYEPREYSFGTEQLDSLIERMQRASGDLVQIMFRIMDSS